MTVHVRVLSSAPEVGLEVGGNGDLLFHRVPGSSSPHPAFLTATLSGASLARARTAGLTLEVRSLGDPSGTGFLYFPVVPGFFGPIATLDGGKTLPSGFGGRTSGGFPVWTHDGTD